MLWLIILLGGLDVALTAWGLNLRVIGEANPLLVWMLGVLGGWTWLIAFTVPALLVVALWCLRRRCRLVLPAMRGLVAARILIVLLHVRWMLAVFA
jgi:hypothetical protein